MSLNYNGLEGRIETGTVSDKNQFIKERVQPFNHPIQQGFACKKLRDFLTPPILLAAPPARIIPAMPPHPPLRNFS